MRSRLAAVTVAAHVRRALVAAATCATVVATMACSPDIDTASVSVPAAEPAAAVTESRDADPLDLGLAGYAKVLCSALFVSNREQSEALVHARTLAIDLLGLPEAEASRVTELIDREHKIVRTTHGSLTRTAQYYGDQGCVIHPAGQNRVFFTPTPVKTRLPDAATEPWPMGDQPSDKPTPGDVDMARVEKAVDLAFADPEAMTTSFLVVHRGRIIAERYAPGVTKDTQLESWSMGKYLNNGVWNGKRLLPAEFVEFVRTIAPAWPEPQYGGQFWVNGDDAWNLPRDAYYAAGSGGQNTFIVPSHDLVIVRMGHHAGGRASRESVRAAQKELTAAIPAKKDRM